MEDDEKLDQIMDNWESGFSPDPKLSVSVRSRIERARVDELLHATSSADTLGDWLRLLLGRPAFALGYAALFAFVGIGAASLFTGNHYKQPNELTLSYRLSIDPLYRLETVGGTPRVGPSTVANRTEVRLNGLGWLQDELDLSAPQFENVSALHTRYERAFDEVFLDLLASHSQYRELDKQRMSNDVIDYFQLFELLETQKRLSEESSKLTAELFKKVAEIITPDQKARYELLIKNLYPHTPEEGTSSTNA